MSKAESMGLMLAILTLAVAIGSWFFPASTTSLTYIYQAESSIQPVDATSTNRIPRAIYQEANQKEPYEIPEVNTQLITEISLDLFISQLNKNTLDSGKVSYIADNKHLLKEKFSFSELNNILSSISLDSKKIDAVRLLANQANPPREDDIETYSELFRLSSNRRTALTLIYDK